MIRALALLCLLLPLSAFAQTWNADLSWQHDGANLGSFRVYAGRSPSALSLHSSIADASARTARITGLADGVWYFALSAVSPRQEESARSNIACTALGTGTCPSFPQLPGPVRNLVVTPVQTPVATITMTQWSGANDLFTLVVPAGVTVRLQLFPSNSLFDWINNTNGTPVPTDPSLGAVNNTAPHSNFVTVTGPVNATAELDGAVPPTGISATVNGVTKSFVRSGSTWSVTFP